MSYGGGGKGYHGNTSGRTDYPGDVLLIKDGAPHYTGEKMELPKSTNAELESY